MPNHGNYIVDHRKSWKNHGIVFSNFCGSPDIMSGKWENDFKFHIINRI